MNYLPTPVLTKHKNNEEFFVFCITFKVFYSRPFKAYFLGLPFHWDVSIVTVVEKFVSVWLVLITQWARVA